MNNIKAIFMDLDGTVLTSEHKVSENLIKKLRELEEEGVKTFIATGRTFISSKPLKKALAVHLALLLHVPWLDSSSVHLR